MQKGDVVFFNGYPDSAKWTVESISIDGSMVKFAETPGYHYVNDYTVVGKQQVQVAAEPSPFVTGGSGNSANDYQQPAYIQQIPIQNNLTTIGDSGIQDKIDLLDKTFSSSVVDIHQEIDNLEFKIVSLGKEVNDDLIAYNQKFSFMQNDIDKQQTSLVNVDKQLSDEVKRLDAKEFHSDIRSFIVTLVVVALYHFLVK